MSKLIILSGIPGSGKSTTADILVEMLQPAIKLYTDEMRHQVTPYAVPWIELGREQLRIAIQAVCAAAEVYLENGYNVVMNDVLIDDIYKLYEDFLRTYHGLSVLLVPSLDVALARDRARDEHVPEERIKQLSAQFKPAQFSLVIDNSEVTADMVAKKIIDSVR